MLTPVWRKASRSNGMGANCVEVAYSGDSVLIRDSKQVSNADYPMLSADRAEWKAMINFLR